MSKIGINTIASKTNTHRKQVQLWRKVNALNFDEEEKIDISELDKITDEFKILYRYAFYKDIEEYFNCSKEEARKLWKSGILKEVELGEYRGHDFPIFLWKDILDQKEEILSNIRVKKTKSKKQILEEQITKDIEEIEVFLKEINKTKSANINKIKNLEQNCIVIYDKINILIGQALNMELNEQKQQMDKIKEEIKENRRKFASFILEHLNTLYHSNFMVEEIIDKIPLLFYNITTEKALKTTGFLDKIFEKALTDILPSEPKNEYIETRRIKRKFYVHVGPTNSGKTYDGIENLKKCNKGIYLSPLRLLALEIYEKLNKENIPCNLITGEEEILLDNAGHTSSTIEKLSLNEEYEVAVIDECQMIQDKQRGAAWTRALLGIKADTIHVCCSPNSLEIMEKIIKDCNDLIEIIEHKRDIPLHFEETPFNFPKSVQDGDALIVFSRNMTIQVASALSEKNISTSIIYGNLPPETRRKQINLFMEGKTKVIVTTDAIGMGVNLPIKRVVFLETSKFDGSYRREINEQEVKQIAGRAGRKNIYDIGLVNSISNRKDIKNKLSQPNNCINYAYIRPSEETILILPFGTIKERLNAWLRYDIKTKYYSKADISDMFNLLNNVEHLEKELGIEKVYKLINIPFKYEEKELLDLWRKYIKALINNTRLTKPICTSKELSDLEIYYQKLNLYYSFAKTFNLSVNIEWIAKEREKTSNLIHLNLKENIKKYSKKCETCGKKLPWDYFYKYCNKCYNNYRQRHYRDYYDNYDDYDDI